MTWKTYFTVVGTTHFPDDMLRYDSCAPASEEAKAAIKSKTHPYPDRESARSQVRVELVHVGDRKNWEPTVGRWNSFMWGVDRNSVRSERA